MTDQFHCARCGGLSKGPFYCLRCICPEGPVPYSSEAPRAPKVVLTVEISDQSARMLRHMLAQDVEDAPGLSAERTLEALARALLEGWADGYRRPGSWERGCLRNFGHAD